MLHFKVGWNTRTNIVAVLLFGVISCSTGEYDMDPDLIEYSEPGFSIKFNDAANCPDGGFILVGRFEIGEYEVYKSIYNYDVNKYPEYVTGSSLIDFPVTMICRVSANGTPEWTRTLSVMKEGIAICSDNHGRYFIAGFEVIESGDELLQTVSITCVTEDGFRKWNKQIGWEEDSYPVDIHVTSDGNLDVLALIESSSRESQMRLIRMTTDAMIIADKVIPDPAYASYSYFPTEFFEDDGITWLLSSNRSNTSTELFVLDENEEVRHGNDFDWGGWNFAQSVAVAPNGIVFTSVAYQDTDRSAEGSRLVALDRGLNTKWEKILSTDVFDPSQVAVSDDGRIIFAGANSDTEELIVAIFDDEGKKLQESATATKGIFKVNEVLIRQNGDIVVVGSAHTSGLNDWRGVCYLFESG